MVWADDAACADMDTGRFFVPRGGKVDVEAKAACARCTVRTECREWALTHERHGYWAGTSERARKQLRRNANTDNEVAS